MLNKHSSAWKQCEQRVFWGEIAPSDHVVQIYEDEDFFLKTLGVFAASGFIAGDAVIVIATAAHLDSLEKRLKESGLDVDSLILSNQYLPVDANSALRKFMVNDWPDEQLFRKMVTTLIARANKGSGRIRAFGEMVAVLWEQGRSGATVHLEHLWKSFCETEAFCIFCAYPKSGFTENAHTSLSEICTMHSKIISGWENAGEEITYHHSHL